MASRKPKKKSRPTASKTPARRKKKPAVFRAAVVPDAVSKLPALFQAAAVIFLVVGVWNLHNGRSAPGFGSLLVSMLLLSAVQFNWIPAPRPRTGAAPAPPMKQGKRAVSAAPAAPVILSPVLQDKRSWLLIGLSVIAFFLGSKVQTAIALSGEAPRFGSWLLYTGAAVLFILGVTIGRKKGIEPEPLSPRVEWGAFGLIMVLAAFLRIYKLDTIPSGLFIDQGMEGWAALRIIHEHFRPIWEFDVFQNPALILYQLAAWFLVFPANQFTFYLFYACLSLATFPLVYWTFRQLGGQRLALAGLFILAVMRWNINFSRNGFPTIEVPFYSFGTLAFLLYGLRSAKKWPFYIAAAFFALGLYTYQAYKVVPVLILLFAVYEIVSNRKVVMARWKSVVGFSVLFLLLAFPYFKHTYELRSLGEREGSLSILSKCRDQHNYAPLWYNITRTAEMFHWRGDAMARHNLQDYRMLDDVTGILFFFGLVLSVVFIWRKSNFYGLIGFLVMCIPCVLSIDAAHANRMLGTTPFIALLAALPLALFWDRLKALLGKSGDLVFVVLIAAPFYAMATQNFDLYFHKQAAHMASWREYAVEETTIAKSIAKGGDAYEYFISPQFYNYYTIEFLGYKQKARFNSLQLPDGLISHKPDISRGQMFFLDVTRPGVLDLVKTIYPAGQAETLIDPAGEIVETTYRVPAEEVMKVRGLAAEFDRPVKGSEKAQLTDFPKNLPPGPYHATLRGNLYISDTGEYRWTFKGNCTGTLYVKGKAALGPVYMEKGYHPVKVVLDVPSGVLPAVQIESARKGTMPQTLDTGMFDTLAPPRGLKGEYFQGSEGKGTPYYVEWDPVLNFTNGNDFSTPNAPSASWTGSLDIKDPGKYIFMVRGVSQVQLTVDGIRLMSAGQVKSEPTHLAAGSHSIRLVVPRPGGTGQFTFSWVRPDGKAEVVPNSAFGLVP